MQKNNWPLLLVTALILAACPLAAQRTKPSKSPSTKALVKHPAIEATLECSDCHEAESKEWTASKHGQALVKCLGCHGSIQENFIPKPAAGRCLACHGALVRNLDAVALTKGKSCFQCHAPHTLDPHISQTGVPQ